MQTIEEIRREWLLELINQHQTIAGLNVVLGRARTDATLSQIKNQAVDSKSGNPRNMGSPLAREIEEKLGLEIGTLDHPISDVDSHPWNDYQVADEAIKLIVDFILSKDTSTPPDWADRDTRAYLDAIELRVRKWIDKGKSSYNPQKARA
ncbi:MULTISPECIES: hypothetical protein [Symbiopectobacterium]|uniref:hypothetical protein n=1 Tax=Symbiopectobacterium TaxID=801 RepID=UPI001A2A0237|nr:MULTISPECIES: hypothetical protein [Symbiopectobacterium]MBG6248365.1 hypothetical protein [Candidatus Symbiopectobacterium sp. PLON1]MBT9430276.1 hypothetical protein [Candidatus Symbiopectobacterium endolongispinus]